ncbi:MAG: LutB/LldF family L-lactate oxidation iron-sulfur protein [Desulfomonilaceae bacterium]|nr:LutB/LldF family L-lactate oxidation iron-sulfur protein [Desulfomonilaceae bacterium]
MKRDNMVLNFRKNAAQALRDASLRDAMHTAVNVFATKRAAGVASVPMDVWREKASAVRLKVIDNLPEYVDRFSENATRAGAIVYRAHDADAAGDIILHILKDRGVRRIVKAKSMVTEEIRLNERLESHGMEVVETDLGEYIVQLAGESPSHILAPAIHKNRRQVGRLFAEKLGVDYSDDPEVLTKIARRVLRKVFLSADAGISGANFAVAETGSLAIFTNEGNGRMVTTLPKIHVAVLTIEKMIPNLDDLATFIRLLPRSATGQALSSYLSIVTGPRKVRDGSLVEQLHIVLLDNGRSRILQGECREILKCIRCSACMNVCPVYKVVGGHAYQSTYPGPMGIILTNELEGLTRAHPLLEAGTLCGACAEACPVKVPLVRLIRRLREQRVERKLTPGSERAGMSAFALAARHRPLFASAQRFSRLLWPLLGALVPGGALKRLPKPAKETFSRIMSRK